MCCDHGCIIRLQPDPTAATMSHDCVLQLDGPFLFLFPWRVKMHFSISFSIGYIKVNVICGYAIYPIRHFKSIRAPTFICIFDVLTNYKHAHMKHTRKKVYFVKRN